MLFFSIFWCETYTVQNNQISTHIKNIYIYILCTNNINNINIYAHTGASSCKAKGGNVAARFKRFATTSCGEPRNDSSYIAALIY